MNVNCRRHQDPEPFQTAEEAWFWFVAAMQARNDGARIVAGLGKAIRPCEPVDIYKALERLYYNRRLMMDHIRVLRHYGQRGFIPNENRPKEILASKLWREAMERLEASLRLKGIVA